MKTAQTQTGNDVYTIVIFRGNTSKPMRLNIPKHYFKKALIAFGILLAVDVAVISHYIIRTGEVWELQTLQSEVLSSRQQTAAFSTAVGDLKKRMLNMKEINQRMRVMLGIDVKASSGDVLNGKGGEETPLEGEQVSEPSATGEGDISKSLNGQSTAHALGESIPLEQIDYAKDQALQAKVKREIEWLDAELGIQEKATKQLLVEAEKRSARWGSTPSIWPVKGWVTSGFGVRVSPFTGRPALHDGLDIGAAKNTPVRAPANGRVTTAGFNSKLGNIVRLDHGYGVQTLYGHMAKSLVKNGQRVKRGDVIGLVGSTGLSTGPHLHYMVKVKGRAVNPRQYIVE